VSVVLDESPSEFIQANISIDGLPITHRRHSLVNGAVVGRNQ